MVLGLSATVIAATGVETALITTSPLESYGRFTLRDKLGDPRSAREPEALSQWRLTVAR